MRRAWRHTDRAELVWYQRIIEMYAPYVLVRCAAFTNSRRLSQEIGAHVLICACLMSSRLNRLERFGFLVETMLDVVGPDVESRGDAVGEEQLLADGRMWDLAQALNRMKRSWREVLVLRSIACREASELAWLLRKPASEIDASLACAAEALAEDLILPGPESTQALLAEFAVKLDLDWIREVGCCAMGFLAADVQPTDPLPHCWVN